MAQSHEADSDPISSSISAHRAAHRAFEEAARYLCDVEEGLVDDGGLDRGSGPDDDPLLIGAIAAFEAASDREARAAWALARAAPSTLTSAVALLRYAREFAAAGCEWPCKPADKRKGAHDDWNCAFYGNLAAALTKLS